MRLQVLRKVGVELQSNLEDADVAGFGGYDGQTKMEMKHGVAEQEEEWNNCLVNEKEREEDLAKPIEEQTNVEPVDKTVADGSSSRLDGVDNQVRDTGLRTVRSLVNGGLAFLALGALSPVGLLLKHLDKLKEEEDVGDGNTEDDNDL
jgi:hypothetical protein